MLRALQDGIDWTKEAYDVVPNTNIVYNDHFDGNVVWLDLDEPNPKARYKQAAVLGKNEMRCFTISESPDGIHWTVTNPCTGAPHALPPLRPLLALVPTLCCAVLRGRPDRGPQLDLPQPDAPPTPMDLLHQERPQAGQHRPIRPLAILLGNS